jgi:hypothetical protein
MIEEISDILRIDGTSIAPTPGRQKRINKSDFCRGSPALNGINEKAFLANNSRPGEDREQEGRNLGARSVLAQAREDIGQFMDNERINPDLKPPLFDQDQECLALTGMLITGNGVKKDIRVDESFIH